MIIILKLPYYRENSARMKNNSYSLLIYNKLLCKTDPIKTKRFLKRKNIEEFLFSV
ncbi:unnamed protein product [Brugia timori]|uniref:Uncharacterized protein n=1 Tax=Brugia timori TaxID=42155 RepID=A0A0R3QL21_9BILA|nr:unnamed protein product [Brugia timori]